MNSKAAILNGFFVLVTCWCMLVTCHVASAQDEDLKSGWTRPRTPIVSEEVVRQKLRTYGVPEIIELKKVGPTYIIKGKYNDRVVDLRMDATTGLLRQEGKLEPLQPATTARIPLIKDHQIKLKREQLVRPELTKVQP